MRRSSSTWRFERLRRAALAAAGEGRQEEARLLREALALWRGRRSLTSPTSSSCRANWRRLEELRLAAGEERI